MKYFGAYTAYTLTSQSLTSQGGGGKQGGGSREGGGAATCPPPSPSPLPKSATGTDVTSLVSCDVTGYLASGASSLNGLGWRARRRLTFQAKILHGYHVNL